MRGVVSCLPTLKLDINIGEIGKQRAVMGLVFNSQVAYIQPTSEGYFSCTTYLDHAHVLAYRSIRNLKMFSEKTKKVAIIKVERWKT